MKILLLILLGLAWAGTEPLSLVTEDCESGLCVEPCCPYGTAYKPNPDYDYEDYTSFPVICQTHPKEDLVWAEKGDIALQESDMKFTCPTNGELVSQDNLWNDVQETRVLPSGVLQVSYIKNVTKLVTEEFPPGQFCLVFTTITGDYDDNGAVEGDMRTIFSVCSIEEVEEGAEFIAVGYPVLLFISAFFIFVTLIVYCIVKDIRSKLFGKLTIGFLINVFFAFLLAAIRYTINVKHNDHLLQTPSCKALGYLSQHFFIAFFFWMSAMTFNITKALARKFHHGHGEKSQMKALLFNIIYAQGIPSIITIVTLIMDNFGDKETQIVPNMGFYSCFIGDEYMLNGPPFHKTAVFLYFYLIICVVMAFNLICFIITGTNLVSQWVEMRKMEQTEKKNGPITQIRLLGNLFIIMGIPWIFEVISAAIEHGYDSGRTFQIRLTLDILNLLQGILIFLALVCKGKLLGSLNDKVQSNFSAASKMTLSSKTSTSSLTDGRKSSVTIMLNENTGYLNRV